MNQPHDSWRTQLAAQPLPTTSRTRHDVEFYPNLDHWKFRTGGKSVSCNFGTLPPVTPAFLHGFKQAMVGVAETQQGSSIKNCFSYFKALLQFSAQHHVGAIDTLVYEDLARFARHSPSESGQLSCSKSFLQNWAALGFHGLAPGLMREFPPCRQGPKGVAVATQDPRKGPLDDQEFEVLLHAINFGLEQGTIELDRVLEVRLMALLGMRPEQLALTKCRDVHKDEYGRVWFDLFLIKAKDQAMRDEFITLQLEPTTGEPLLDYRDQVQAAFAGRLPAPGDARLFPQVDQTEETEYAPGLTYHSTGSTLGTRISRTLATSFKTFRATSVRLGGETIPVSPVRLRRSFAQRGADEGIDIWTLAHLLSHRTIGNVKVYFEVTDRIRARFSKKMALQMAPLANAFGAQLRILKDLSEATRPIHASRIPDLRLDEHGDIRWLASCASCASCSELRPYACLAGCPSFEPFLDAELEPILDRLISDREHGMETDKRIAEIRDRAIYGCAQIILRQRELIAPEAQ